MKNSSKLKPQVRTHETTMPCFHCVFFIVFHCLTNAHLFESSCCSLFFYSSMKYQCTLFQIKHSFTFSFADFLKIRVKFVNHLDKNLSGVGRLGGFPLNWTTFYLTGHIKSLLQLLSQFIIWETL